MERWKSIYGKWIKRSDNRIGPKAKEPKISKAKETANEYIERAEDREGICPLYIVEAFKEPVEFSLYFHGWDWKDRSKLNIESLEKIIVQVVGNPLEEGKVIEVVSPDHILEDEEEEEGEFVDYDRLTEKPTPPGLDSTKLESYLSSKDFRRVFEMTKAEFYQQPRWRQTQLKKEKQLF